MGKFNKVSSDVFENLQFGAGMILKTFNPTTPAEPEESDIVCATTGGVEIKVTPEYVDLGDGIDNCPVNTKELKKIQSTAVTMSFTALDITTATLKLALGAATVASTKVTPNAALASTDFSDLWWVGETTGGGLVAAKIINALSTGGLSIKSEDKGKGQLAVELTGHVSIENQDVVPAEFYVIETVA